MKKSTMETVLTLIAEMTSDEAVTVRNEIEAELAKGKEKAEANKKVYEGIHDAVIAVLAGSTQPLTAQELADETGLAKGKIVYGLANYWQDEIEKIEGKTNTYQLKA